MSNIVYSDGVAVDLDIRRPRYELPSGKIVSVDVRHLVRASGRRWYWNTRKKGNIRFTVVHVLQHYLDENGVETFNPDVYTGKSVCNPCDNFCKATGRKEAGKRVISSRLPKGDYAFSKEDREAIFFLVCPEFDQYEPLAKKLPKRA